MVLAFVETDDGEVEETSLEMLTLARDVAEQVGEDVEAVSINEDVADELGPYGVDTLYVIEDDRLEPFAPEAWAEALGALVDEVGAEAVLGGGSDRVHEVFAHLAAKRDLPMAANTTSVEVDGEYRIERQRWGGSLIEHAKMSGETKLLTAPEHEIAIEEVGSDAPAVETFSPEIADDAFEVQIDRIEESDIEGVPLSEARIVVAGGRGVGGPEDFDQLEALAEVFESATVGASRVAVDEGWRPHDDQIGQTGAKISPDLYIAAGISGAIQHWVGAKGAEKVMAINTDPEAAIMYKGDYAIVGDLHEVVPELTKKIKEAKEQ